MKERRKIQNIFVPDPQFQKYFMLYFVGSNVLAVILCASFAFPSILQFFGFLEEAASVSSEARRLLEHYNSLVQVLGYALGAYLLILFALGAVYSHRIGGVVYAIKRTCKALTKGKDEVLKVRKYDEFQGVQEIFNEMVNTCIHSKKEKKKAA